MCSSNCNDKVVVVRTGPIGPMADLSYYSGSAIVSGSLTVIGSVDFSSASINIPRYVSVPSSSNASGSIGDRAYASGSVYECIALNTWVKYNVSSSF